MPRSFRSGTRIEPGRTRRPRRAGWRIDDHLPADREARNAPSHPRVRRRRLCDLRGHGPGRFRGRRPSRPPARSDRDGGRPERLRTTARVLRAGSSRGGSRRSVPRGLHPGAHRDPGRSRRGRACRARPGRRRRPAGTAPRPLLPPRGSEPISGSTASFSTDSDRSVEHERADHAEPAAVEPAEQDVVVRGIYQGPLELEPGAAGGASPGPRRSRGSCPVGTASSGPLRGPSPL